MDLPKSYWNTQVICNFNLSGENFLEYYIYADEDRGLVESYQNKQ